MPVLRAKPQVARLPPTALRFDRTPPPRYREIEKCRICGNENLVPVLSLGEQFLTGVFPRGLHATLSKGPLELVACAATENEDACGLVQLRQSYELGELYGENYGYRSSLNASMVRHLKSKVDQLIERYPLQSGDLVLDIGSNDGTLLSFYPEKNVTVVGIDPTGRKFASYYRKHITLLPDFFSADLFGKMFGSRRARIVTSISMFYDLESPLRFMEEVASILDEEGVWHFEMSYMPSMVRTMGYDTICHEHLEYYSLHQIKWMTDRSGLKILDVAFNDINGGSFAVTVARRSSKHARDTTQIKRLLREEKTQGLSTLAQQRDFRKAVEAHKKDLLSVLHILKAEKRTVLGYGASTKGNVLLQHCGISRDLLPAIAEVNQDKFGCFTPGTNIPIISEAEAHAMKPDYLFVLPWHFRANIIEREQAFLNRGGRLLFPLPAIEIVGG
ncbi:MAG TPA: class I SAM-dependent methyltransferase [Chthoniobacterales bacterium]|nr:class I SAM-dependent methyltransferase [Chthoniobacterales bacterium]